MILKRFYDDTLAQASYMMACETAREAIVFDPGLDTDIYLQAAAAERLRIAHVTETHIHADFVSGAAELARAADATLHLSAEGGTEWGYLIDADRNVERLRDGDVISAGSVAVGALHTPGHTPEHLTFLVTDEERGAEPVGAVTGDFIFVGDVGRPDLLERAAGATGSMESAARDLYRSLESFLSRPDHLQLWPGHGAGSACGKALGAMPASTLGYEKRFNWAFAEKSEDAFVSKVLDGQPVPPRYFAEMKRRNRHAEVPPPIRDPRKRDPKALAGALAAGATVIDTRAASVFAKGHVQGAINIPANKSFLNWVGSVVPYDREIFLITDSPNRDAVKAIARSLRRIGISRLGGYFAADAVAGNASSPARQEQVPQLSVDALRSMKRGTAQVVDVRAAHEWDAGHLPGALHIPLAALPERISELDGSRPVVLHCKGGGRSSIAASLLQARGIFDVANLEGGFDAWEAAGFGVERDRSK